jgi:hypothetical protein
MKRQKLEVTLGSDPELMLFDIEQNKMVSAIKVLCNDKKTPTSLGDGILMYADNVLVETAFPPAKTKEDFIETIRKAFQRMQLALGRKFKLHPQAAFNFEKDQLDDKRAWESGCDPNFDVYLGRANERADFTSGLRTGSFHIHVGNQEWETNPEGLLMSDESKGMAIRLLDIFVGVPSVIFDRDFSSGTRRKLYGKAGEHRPTPYGIEYRVLGNYALRNPEMVNLVVDLLDYALDQIRDNKAEELIRRMNSSMVQTAINENSTVAAMEVLKESKLPGYFFKRIWEDYRCDMYREWNIVNA